MNILVTGAKGQLGMDLVAILGENHRVIGCGRQELDVTSLEQCRKAVGEAMPDVIIHSAAYTAVDQAESEPDTAYRVNVEGSRNIAIAAEEAGAKLCMISTDYVFDGKATTPYREEDSPNPQTVYGKTKRAAELQVHTQCSRYFIVRTSWVYGAHGNNFVHTMLRLAERGGTIKVVNDQVGAPTYTVDLCRFIGRLFETEQYGVYHASGGGQCSWFEFARAIFEERGLAVALEPCSTAEFPRPAPRPNYSVLDHAAIREKGLPDLRPWRESLHDYLGRKGQV